MRNYTELHSFFGLGEREVLLGLASPGDFLGDGDLLTAAAAGGDGERERFGDRRGEGERLRGEGERLARGDGERPLRGDGERYLRGLLLPPPPPLGLPRPPAGLL